MHWVTLYFKHEKLLSFFFDTRPFQLVLLILKHITDKLLLFQYKSNGVSQAQREGYDAAGRQR